MTGLLSSFLSMSIGRAHSSQFYGQLADADDRVVIAIGGKEYVLERSGDPVDGRTVAAPMHGQLLNEPAYPLFGDQNSGRLTVRGEHALNRFNFG
jgi:hypothetical protein